MHHPSRVAISLTNSPTHALSHIQLTENDPENNTSAQDPSVNNRVADDDDDGQKTIAIRPASTSMTLPDYDASPAMLFCDMRSYLLFLSFITLASVE